MPDSKGFTLIELMISISIVAIMATIGLILFSQTQGTARDAKRKQDLLDIRKAFYEYSSANGTFCLQGKGSVACANTCWGAYISNGTISGTASSSSGGLGPYFKSYPSDPKYNGTSKDYYVDVCGDDKLDIEATLENPPPASANVNCVLNKDGVSGGAWNYCISE